MTAVDTAAADTAAAGGRTGTAVHLIELRKTFAGKTKALDGFSVSIAAGELVVLLGPSGCGKTTALRALAGLEDIDSGRVVAGEQDLTGLSAAKRDMAMVFQAYSLFPHLTALENVEFGLRVRGVDKAARRRKAGHYLDMVGLADQAEKYTHQMSGGQQQRVALARALAIEPQVLLLDEPLSALDAKVRVGLREEIRRLQIESGITTLFVTHDQEEALAVADRVGVMQAGQLAQIGSPAEIYERPTSDFVASFIGLTNRVPGKVVAADRADIWGQMVPLLPGAPAGGDVTVLIRPEAVELRPASGPVGTGGNLAGGDLSDGGAGATSGTVTGVSFLGSHSRIGVMMPEGVELTAQTSAELGASLRLGDTVAVTLLAKPALAV